MSTATMQRAKTGSWTNVFPNEQVTAQQSALFVKKLLAVAVSNITYLRAIFPEHAFRDRCLEDLDLKVLRDDSACPGACQVIKWIKGCFDALDKKYLRMMIIGIYLNKDNPDTVIESYTFKFSYGEKGGVDVYRNDDHISSAYSAAETKKATMRLLRTIVVLTQSLNSLPDDVMMTMRLLYYDDVTPADYEPPGFHPATSDVFNFVEDPMNVKIGDVSTSFHTVKLRIKTDAKQFEVSEDKAMHNTHDWENTQSTQDNVPMEEDTQEEDPTHIHTPKVQPAMVSEPAEGDDVPCVTPNRPESEAHGTVTTPSTQSVQSQSQEDQTVRCPCGCNEDDGLMILCANCKFWQHAVCFAITKEEDAPERHICNECAHPLKPERAPTDPGLQFLSEVATQAKCLWRRALLACTETNRIVQTKLAARLGVELTVAMGLVNRLEKEGYLKTTGRGKRLGKVVNKQKILNEGVPRYLQLNKQDQPLDNAKTTEGTDNSKENKKEASQDTEKHEVNVEIEKKKVGQETDKDKKSQEIEKDLEELTKKTDEISISGSQKRSQKRSQHDAPDITEEQENKTDQTERQSRGRKRVTSRDGSEFEISNSQDVDCSNRRSKRRRKASIAARPIMV